MNQRVTVRVVIDCVINQSVWPVGSVVETDAEQAAALIARGEAEPVEAEAKPKGGKGK